MSPGLMRTQPNLPVALGTEPSRKQGKKVDYSWLSFQFVQFPTINQHGSRWGTQVSTMRQGQGPPKVRDQWGNGWGGLGGRTGQGGGRRERSSGVLRGSQMCSEVFSGAQQQWAEERTLQV